MVSAVNDSHAIVDALGEGANDYVVKPVDLPVMDARIQSQLLRSQAERQDRLLDPLTGLGNRTMFLSQVERALSPGTILENPLQCCYSTWMASRI